MNSDPNKLEHKLAKAIRMLTTNFNGEINAAANAIVRIIDGAKPDQIHALADRLENSIQPLPPPVNDHGLTKEQIQQIYDAGFHAGVQETENKIHGVNDFIGADGKPTWEAVALFLQRSLDRLDPQHHKFVNDMASRTTWGQEPTERQHKYLHSLFLKLGGKIT